MEHRRELRVVQVSPFYSPVVGGVETVVRQVAEYLASRGVESWVVTYDRLRRGKAKLPREEEIGGVKGDQAQARPQVVPRDLRPAS